MSLSKNTYTYVFSLVLLDNTSIQQLFLLPNIPEIVGMTMQFAANYMFWHKLLKI